MDDRDSYRRYLDVTLIDPAPAAPGWRRLARAVVPQRLRVPARWSMTICLTPLARSRARRIAATAREGLKLHLGSGPVRKEGWINIDLAGAPVDIPWDLTRPLPFPDESVDAIFHEHLLEHLTLQQGFDLLEDCCRVLRRDGVLRIGVPDGGAYLEAYCVRTETPFLRSVRPDRPTRLLAIQEVFYRYAHRSMYDFETLDYVCRAAGFLDVQQRRFGESRLDPCPDTDFRRPETLYVEASK